MVASGTPPLLAPCYRSAEALAADGGLVVAKDLPDGTSGIEALGQKEGSIEEEERSCSIDDILECVDSGEDTGKRRRQRQGGREKDNLLTFITALPLQAPQEGQETLSWEPPAPSSPPRKESKEWPK